jgi:hypothetical protein
MVAALSSNRRVAAQRVETRPMEIGILMLPTDDAISIRDGYRAHGASRR